MNVNMQRKNEMKSGKTMLKKKNNWSDSEAKLCLLKYKQCLP